MQRVCSPSSAIQSSLLTFCSFGFVMYYSPASAENCIRGFFHLGFQASYAQKSRNARLKDLEDRSSTNIYCTGVPIEWNEAVCVDDY